MITPDKSHFDRRARRVGFRQWLRSHVLGQKVLVPSPRDIDVFGESSSSSDKVNSVTPAEAAAIVREMIRHEDSVLNQRLTWCVGIQALLFTALAFAWQNAPPPLMFLIGGVGIFISISTTYSSVLTVRTMVDLTRKWLLKYSTGYDGPPVIGRDARKWNPLFRPSRGIPMIFGVVWIMILVFRLLCLLHANFWGATLCLTPCE